MKLELTNVKSWRKSTFEFSDSACTLISGPSGQGKCFVAGTKILLFSGKTKVVENITSSDVVMGWDSKPRKVISVTTGSEQLFKIQGYSPSGKRIMKYTVNASHTLTLLRQGRFAADISVADYLASISSGIFYQGFRAEITYPETPAVLPPYIYGVLMFGGHENIDPRVLRAMNPEMQRIYGFYYTRSGNLESVFGRRFRRGLKPVRHFYSTVDMISQNEPEILLQYRHNSVDFRKEVLAGLVDRHGGVTNDGEISLEQITPKLASSIIDLVQSLGGYCYKITNILFIGLVCRIPTRILRGYRLFPRGFKLRVEPVGIGRYYGFMLSGDGRFCLGDYTVTHNSSILQGIEFALFGTGKNLVSHGETSCTAKLTVGDAIITRTKRPNRLVLQTPDGELEDDAAQAWISRKFSAKASITPFITMTPAEKLAFLEKAAFRDIDIAKLKELAKNRVKTHEISLAKAQQQLQTTQSFLASWPEPGSPPEGYNDLEETNLRKIEKRLKNARVMVTKIRRSIDHYRKLLEDSAETRNLISLLEARYDSLTEELETLPDPDLAEIRVKLAMKKKALTCAENYEAFLRETERKTRLETDLSELQRVHEAKLTELTTVITAGKEAETPYQEITAELDKLEKYATLVERIDLLEVSIQKKAEYETELQGIPERREQLLRADVVQIECPCCGEILGYRNGTLTALSAENTTSDDTMESLKKLESRLNRKLAKIEEAEAQLKGITESAEALESTLISEEQEAEYIDRLPQLEELISKAKTAETEKSIEDAKYESNSRRISREISQINLDEVEPCLESSEQIREEIDQINGELQIAVGEASHRRAKLQELNTVEARLEKLKVPSDTQEYTEKLQKLGKDLPEYESKVAEYTETIEVLRDFAEYQRGLDEYTLRQEKVNEATAYLEQQEAAYSTAVSFRQKIVDAETVTLGSVINTLNVYAADYLSAFFPDNPIIVEIMPYKETAKRGGTTRKSQITTRVEYRGAESDITSLSSGERDRVILAFSLAVNQLQAGRIIMLDECTSSLDAETSNTVFSKIRQNLEDRCVLIVAHQIVQGIFDDVLEV